MNQLFRFSIFKTVCVVLLCIAGFTTSRAQSSGVQPTPVPGWNAVYYDEGTRTYSFYHENTLLYAYSILSGVTTNGGTFNELKAYDNNVVHFLPSGFGGISAMLGGVEVTPGSSGVSFHCLDHRFLSNDTVYAHWAMAANSEVCNYVYKFKIVGRTLVIRIETDSVNSNSNIATAVDLDMCRQASGASPIAIPYLSMFSLLYTNDLFVSMFADWEITNASKLFPLDPIYDTTNGTWAYYAHNILYNPKTDGKRNRVQETLYLTTATNLEDVLPNIPNPPSPMKDVSANQIVWDYRQPFARLIRTPWRHIDSVWNLGVSNIWLQIHDWQNDHSSTPAYLNGYDDGLPCVLPANENDIAGWEFGGASVLNTIITKARFSYEYRIGLHQNYIDYYENADCAPFGYQSTDVALSSAGSRVEAWYNKLTHTQSYVLKPSRAAAYANYWSIQIQNSHHINGCYLDVHSAVNPSDRIDYHASVTQAGKFRETLQKYRELFPILRQNHGGPVQGEGNFHFLHIGYADDVEARLNVPTNQFCGYYMPLLSNYKVNK
ncbi:MAG: hypothetical protein HY961_11995, partial [Ignavibacteriae bacterium]|nr:hypothetical protein [Ignavibacteriota bacterium]